MPDHPPARIVLGVNEEFRITLRSLAMAGYRWQGAVSGPDADAVALELHRGELPAAAKPGASVPEEAVIRGLRPGRSLVRLQQGRPWERGSPPTDVIELEVEVRA